MRRKSASVAWAILLFLSLPVLSWAETVCFEENVAGSLVVELERCRSIQERIDLYQKANAELERQVELLQKIVDLKDREIEVLERTNSKYRDLVTTQEEMYGQILKAQNQNALQKAIEALGFIGLGVILVLLL